MYCYSPIQHLCEPCRAITARALPPESPYCLRPPTRLLPPTPTTTTAATDSCHLSWDAVCCVSRQRPRRRLLPRKHRRRWTCKEGVGRGDKKQKTQRPAGHRVSFYCRNRLCWSAAAVPLVAVGEPPRTFACAVGGAFGSAGKMR